MHGLITLFMASAIFGKCSNLAVIAFQRIEVRVGCPKHVLARPALIWRNIVNEARTGNHKELDCRFVNIPIIQLLNFLYLSAIDLQPNGDERVASLNLEPRLNRNLTKNRIGDMNLEACRLDF